MLILSDTKRFPFRIDCWQPRRACNIEELAIRLYVNSRRSSHARARRYEDAPREPRIKSAFEGAFDAQQQSDPG